MTPIIVILVYLALIAFIGSIAFRRGKDNTEDFFLANRSVGAMVFFLSIFATNMTAFAILGSSGQAYRQGIGIYGLMASSSWLVIPLTIFFIGTRLWALGKKFGHQTQVSFFRDRWECDAIGTVIFALSAVMLVPYMIISIMGGGTVLAQISTPAGPPPLIPYSLGCAVVAVVVTLGVFLGGMRGTVWVNILQTTLFLCFGAVAVAVHQPCPARRFRRLHRQTGRAIPRPASWSRARRCRPRPSGATLSFRFPRIMFPHMAIMCFSARRVTAFKQTVVLYPLAILADLAALRVSRRPGRCRAGQESPTRTACCC